MGDRRLHAGDIVSHFKRDMISADEAKTNMYLYKIVGIAEDSETKESVVVYQALYGDFKMYVRPYAMFMSQVDKTKYPEAKQTFRFEKFNH